MELRLINLQAAEENQVLTMQTANILSSQNDGRGAGGITVCGAWKSRPWRRRTDRLYIIMANYGMEVIDSGVAVLNMHAPYEVSSKADVYEAVKDIEHSCVWNNRTNTREYIFRIYKKLY